ncbi:MAG: thioredoxin [Bacteroidota bacterium]|jgi:thioredoxin 1
MASQQEFSTLIQQQQPVLVDFFATWCGPCKMMTPILTDVKAKLGEQVRIIKIDVDKHPALAAELQVQGVPTLMLFKSGKLLWRQSGVVPAAQLQQIIQKNS